jgi:hypothetical protein
VLTKRISLNPNLDFSQISYSGVRESSQRLKNEYGSLVVPAASKGGRGEDFILPKKKLASKNQNI